MVQSGPDSAFRTRFIPIRAYLVHDLVNAHRLSVQYVASEDNAADALTRGLGATTHRKARLLLCLTEQW
eukprot:11937272-Prorocentrum_lima.AAC.1